MKKIHQMVKSTFSAFLAALCILIFISNANAGILYFKMTAPKTTLEIGEEVTVSVSAFIDDALASPDNGLDTWQLDLSVSQTGIVEITKTGTIANINLIAPDPDPDWSRWTANSVNSPNTGEVRNVSVIQNTIGNPSVTGVGQYSEIFNFKIKAIGAGSTVYSICNDGGGGFFAYLADDTLYDADNAPGSVVFDAANSNNVFTVVPEPCSIAFFAFAGMLALRKK
jgi:hypothetical protein